MGNLEMRSSRLGYMSTFVWSLIWLVGFAMLACVFYSLAQSHAASIGEGWRISYYDKHLYYLYLFLTGGSVLVMGLTVVANFLMVVYELREVNTFVMGKNGNWKTVVCTQYSFPGSVSTEETIIDRVLAVEVGQSMIDRLCGVGTLNVTAVTFVNSGTDEYVFTIPCILNSSAARDAIMAAAGEHHGLDVRTAVKL